MTVMFPWHVPNDDEYVELTDEDFPLPEPLPPAGGGCEIRPPSGRFVVYCIRSEGDVFALSTDDEGEAKVAVSDLNHRHPYWTCRGHGYCTREEWVQ